ncbi:hypothetical protein [Aurantimonas sp. 22II-16-19i]|uniref:hypothetical protein n=1 Tax=Aurantimonas sp. 22II-16-19i TaxID=1317114 RepID=UPI0009F7AFF6|nr:hypothetical protein [Aurantimonas sp. 22II-16-19i]ORE99009.1 hypothetical protein ATO4_01545 [Aurantimonas sp. 22II-16-19i]
MSSRTGEIRENLEYVRDMLEQLKVVSGVAQGDMLLYFLDMGKLEVDERLARLEESSGGKASGRPG